MTSLPSASEAPSSPTAAPETLSSETDNPRRQSKGNAATGASAAGIRALSAQLVAFYFRAPAKAFFRTRIDYLQLARAVNPRIQAKEPWSLRMSTPALLAHAVRTHGWAFVPNQILPPLVANVGVGAILYTTYLQTLSALYPPSAESTKRVFPPPPPSATFTAGFLAGIVQSLAAAPLDALQVRFKPAHVLDGQYPSMWAYGRHQLRVLGFRGVVAGWTASTSKEAVGCGVFFAVFEYVKQQSYYTFIANYYGRHRRSDSPGVNDPRRTIVPHFALEPAFLLLAGILSSLAQQTIHHPMTRLQQIYYGRLESVDRAARALTKPSQLLRLYWDAYAETLAQARKSVPATGGWRRWLFRGFWSSALRQVPSTSAGLIVFELVRRKYGVGGEQKAIQVDGFDILLS
ncbi:MAG: hypothetical protein M1825_005451 [Sarcosagium campestre]|nr:MAG: hypothetical protein M1825_005451 [Sarcosagium campestre]